MAALREQNLQVAAGQIGQRPSPAGLDFQYAVRPAAGCSTRASSATSIVKTGGTGQVTRLKDVARVERGARNYDMDSFLDGQASVGVAVFQRPGIQRPRLGQSAAGPDGATARSGSRPASTTASSTTRPCSSTSRSRRSTTRSSRRSCSSFIVVLVFLQDWKGTILPMIDVPVSLIGTFAVMAGLGFTLNNLTLFGLVLAIGIVVDDAIVVLENIERWIARGLAREATIKAMAEITGPGHRDHAGACRACSSRRRSFPG